MFWYAVIFLSPREGKFKQKNNQLFSWLKKEEKTEASARLIGWTVGPVSANSKAFCWSFPKNIIFHSYVSGLQKTGLSESDWQLGTENLSPCRRLQRKEKEIPLCLTGWPTFLNALYAWKPSRSLQYSNVKMDMYSAMIAGKNWKLMTTTLVQSVRENCLMSEIW